MRLMHRAKEGEEGMKKIGSSIFVAACLILCLVPFAGMAAAPTNTTTENRRLVSFPEIKKAGRWNQEWLQEAGQYFEDHFAFRPYFVTADSEIMGRGFQVSNVDTVIDGDDGWLYYTATVKDYLGEDTLSEREVYNILHNLSLLKQYVEDQGGRFLFTVAPNKNSLYGEHMPYYAGRKAGGTKNIELLKAGFEEKEIPYADLFSVFEDEKEVLYLKRDSHWNQKGAVLACNKILDSLGKKHETYETVPAVRTKTEYGDLNLMLYPKSAVPEWNYQYEKEPSYRYVTDFQSVEDAWIRTSNDQGEGSLLMFRDSFGNTLLPLMADTYKEGYFSKIVPYPIEEYMEECHTDTVVVEKVERNLREFLTEPPVMTGIPVKLEGAPEEKETKTTLRLKESEYDLSYLEISGTLDEEYAKADTDIYVSVKCGDDEQVYEAFTVAEGDSAYGYLCYLPKASATSDTLEVCVMAGTKKAVTIVKRGMMQIPVEE